MTHDIVSRRAVLQEDAESRALLITGCNLHLDPCAPFAPHSTPICETSAPCPDMAESGGIQAEVGVGLLLPGTSAESANEFERALTALLSPTAMCQELDALSAKIFGNLQVGKSEDCELAGWDEAHCRAGEDDEDEDKIAVDLHNHVVGKYSYKVVQLAVTQIHLTEGLSYQPPAPLHVSLLFHDFLVIISMLACLRSLSTSQTMSILAPVCRWCMYRRLSSRADDLAQGISTTSKSSIATEEGLEMGIMFG